MLIRAVLDTNVIVASLRSRDGASFEIMDRLRRGKWRLVLSNHLLLEYEEVLKRNHAFLGLKWSEIDSYLDAFCQAAEHIPLTVPGLPRLPDPDDEPLLRLAEASGARLITTHNFGHLQPALQHGVAVLRPGAFLRMLDK